MKKDICQGRGCEYEVADNKLFCWKHWFGLSRDLRRKLASTYRPGKKPSKVRLEAIQQAIDAIPVTPPRDTSPTTISSVDICKSVAFSGDVYMVTDKGIFDSTGTLVKPDHENKIHVTLTHATIVTAKED